MSAAAQLGASGSLQQELSSFLSQYLVGADRLHNIWGRPAPLIDRHLSAQLLLPTAQSKDVVTLFNEIESHPGFEI